MCKVSVIIPVWNAGNKIRRCLDSLLNQTLSDIELICVLDCPTDGTDYIVEQYTEKDSRVIILRNDHSLHVSESRNKGISIAHGEYIGFCDHDDFCDKTMFEDLYYAAKDKNADIVASNATILKFNGEKEIQSFVRFTPDEIIASIIQPWQEKKQCQSVSHCIWHSIYKTSFLIDNNISFHDRKIYKDEDRLFNLEAYLASSNIFHVNKAYYTWDQHVDSTSNTDFENLSHRIINMLEYIVKLLIRQNALKPFIKNVYQLINYDLVTLQSNINTLSKDDIILFVKILKQVKYSLFKGRFDIKMISRRRLRIYMFLISQGLIF